jgi:hypothetical protein
MADAHWRRILLASALVAFSLLALTACQTAQPTVTPTPTRLPRPTYTMTPRPPSPTVTPAVAATSTHTPLPQVQPQASPTPTGVLNPLTGLPISQALLQKRPILVCLDNDVGARPQYGLAKADVVYEYYMENYFNTRYTAVFWGQEADRIGPMRSARLINLELTPEYDGFLACEGGSDAVRYLLVDDKRFYDYTYLDMDLWGDGYYSIYGRHADPNVNTVLTQTSTDLLRKWLQSKGKEKPVQVKGFTFSPAGSATPVGMPAQTVSIPYPSYCCNVQWTYDAASGRYLRSVQGQPQTDGATKERLSAANVLIIYADHQKSNILEAEPNGYGFDIKLRGEGKATVLRDGVATAALWRRDKLTDFMQVVDASGAPIPLHPGNTWVEVVPDVNFTVDIK